MVKSSKDGNSKTYRGLEPGQLPTHGIPRREVSGLGALRERGDASESVNDSPFELPVDDALFETGDQLLENWEEAPTQTATMNDLADSTLSASLEVDVAIEVDRSERALSEREQSDPMSVAVTSEELAECAIPPINPARKRPSDVNLAAIFDVRERMALQNPFQVLGLAPGAPLSAIRDVCARLMSKYDAAKYRDVMMTDESLMDLKDIREHVAFCAKSLCDPARRGIIERLAGGDHDAVRIRRYFSADQLFRQGVNHLRAKAFVEAKNCIEQAISDDPNAPDYHTRLAQTMIEIHRSGGTFNAAAQTTIAGLLATALALDPHYEPAALLLGRVLIAKREFAQALACYQRVLVTNLRNQEARRAVRQLAAKVGSSRPEKEESGLSGLFDRFWKDR